MKQNTTQKFKPDIIRIVRHLMKKHWSLVVLLALFTTFSQGLMAQNALVPFTFKLTTASKTSAGVYKKDGTLVRTLWGGVSYPSGTHTKTWDRKDDYGRLITDTGLIVKVLSNNVNYLWEGVIGNTSDSTHGISVIHSYYRMEAMVIEGNFAYFGTGYSEGTTATNKFLLNKPQQNIPIMYQQYGTNMVVNFTATDGNYVYWSGFDAYGGQYQSTSQVSLTYATSVSSDDEVLFSSGTPVQMGTGRQYKKAIDVIYNSDPVGNPTGLAVQRNGKFLFISHGGLNKINVLNKSTGSPITSISISNPRELCVDKDDNLWIISGTNTVEKYAIDTTTGTLSGSALVSLAGLEEPLNMEVSPNNYNIVVIDGGNSQQIKSYSNYSGVSLWTYGQYGGYASDPLVTNDKFYFTDSVTEMRHQFIAFQPDSSFWVSDGGNERVQHYSSSLSFIDNIMYMPATYSTQVDRNDPTRAFNEFLEFKIDYSKPLAPNNGSWVLYKNWKRGVPATHRDKTYNAFIFQGVITMSNGRTYATLYNASNKNLRRPEIVELPASGQVRLTGILFAPYSDEVIEIDGSRRSYERANAADTGFWVTKQFKGFDSQNNPTWYSSAKIASVYASEPNDPSYDPIYGTLSSAVKTSSDVLPVFNHSLKGGYHLGGVKVGDNKFLWKTAMATFGESAPNAGDQYKGEYPPDGSYDIGNDVKIGGSNVYTIDKNIFWNYHGEFWGGGQTNKWNHVYDNGLLVSQFGITTADARLMDWDAPPMLAGNVFSSTVVKVGNDLYVYHNDEAVHSGLHRWKITNLNSIQEQTATLSYTITTGGLTATYFDGKYLNSFNRKTTRVDATVNNNSLPVVISNTTNTSTRWSGYVQPAYTQAYTFYTTVSKGVKLWVDGNLIITQWAGNSNTEYTSSTIKLEGGKKYSIKMEINGGTAALSWSSSSQAKQIIPTSALYPAEFPVYTSDGVDLMEGLGSRTILEDGMYGWNRNPAKEDNNWHVNVGLRSLQKDNPDVWIKFSNSTGTNAVTRDLGKVIPCLSKWTIAGNLSFAGNDPNFLGNNFGGFFDILDGKGKVISRITNERLWAGKNPTSIKFNGLEVVNKPAGEMALISNKPQPFAITVDANGINFQYGDFAPINTTAFDPTSDWKQPATIKFYFTTSSVYPNTFKAINVEKLKFFTVAPAIPEITISGANKFCQGDSVTLTSSNSTTYLWSNNATTQSIVVKNTGNFVVIAKDNNGCPLPSDTAKITVNQLPVATITASGATTFCQGDSVTLTASNANSYLWSNNATSNKITLKDPGLVSLIVKDALGCTSLPKAPVQISVNPLPTVPTVTTDKATVFCMGDTITLTSSSANSYLWNNNATTQSIKAVISGDYSVKVGDANGCYNTSTKVPLKANIVPKTDITPSGSTSICQGESVTLTASPAVSYLWSNNETTQSITVDAADDYMVITKDANECFSASPITSVNVNALPEIPKINVIGDVLTSSSANGNQWYFNDVIIQGATARTYTATQNGKYTVKVSDGNSCSSTSDPYNCLTIGLNYLLTQKIEIVPNPSTGIIELKSQYINSGEISISNALGAVVYTAAYNGEPIDMTNFAKGVYTVQLLTSQQLLKGKVIIQ